MRFEITSSLYRGFLWVLLFLELANAALLVSSNPQVLQNMPLFMQVVFGLGVAIKIALVVILSMKKGPIKMLVYIWGSLAIFSGSTGILSLLISPSAISMGAFANHAFVLALGLALILPFGKVVRFEKQTSNA